MVNKIKYTFIEMSPVLEVDNIQETIDFYTDKLGFNLDFKWPEEGEAEHAGVSLGNSDHEDPVGHVHLHLTLTDGKAKTAGWLYFVIGREITELYQMCRENKVEITSELSLRPWEMYEFHIKENNGHTFRFAYNPHEGGDLDL
jgi:catechol 2,3-dioxygenase-like lactoylglutathione lyase family enzyme